MKENDNVIELKASEVKLTYNSKIKASDRICIRNAEDATELFYNYWDFDKIEHVEEMKLLLLNRSHKVLGVAHLSTGGVIGTTVDIKVICQYAIKANASAVILVHNHPSGSLIASDADKGITKRVSKALGLLDIHLLDHLIITADRKYVTVEDG